MMSFHEAIAGAIIIGLILFAICETLDKGDK